MKILRYKKNLIKKKAIVTVQPLSYIEFPSYESIFQTIRIPSRSFTEQIVDKTIVVLKNVDNMIKNVNNYNSRE